VLVEGRERRRIETLLWDFPTGVSRLGSLLGIGDIPCGFRAEAVYRSSGCDVESTVVVIPPSEICRLFWKSDCANVLAIGIPHPYTFRASDAEVAIPVEPSCRRGHPRHVLPVLRQNSRPFASVPLDVTS
jgi:hypothetical protein